MTRHRSLVKHQNASTLRKTVQTPTRKGYLEDNPRRSWEHHHSRARYLLSIRWPAYLAAEVDESNGSGFNDRLHRKKTFRNANDQIDTVKRTGDLPESAVFQQAARSEEHHSREAPGCPEWHHSESDVPSLSEKTVSATRQDRKHLLRRQTQTLLARTGTQPGHPDPPSPTARPCLQPLPPEASLPSERMSTEPKCCKQRTYRIAKSFRCKTYEKTGGRGCYG